MIERRSIVLTGVVLAMLFTGMVLYLFTSGGLQRAKVAIDEDQDLGLEEEITEELEALDVLETLETLDETVAGVTLRQAQGEEEPQDIVPTVATGAKGYVVMAAGLAVLMGSIGLVTAWRKSSVRQVGL